jgi:hypothetical protein
MTTLRTADVTGLPAELKELGRPDEAFPAKALASTTVGMALLAGGVLMLATGAGAIYGYFHTKFPKDGPPAEIVLGVGIFAIVMGLVMMAFTVRRPKGQGEPNSFCGYLAYPTALVRLKDGRCEIFRWDEIEAFVNPANGMADFQIQAQDGRKLPVDRAIVGYMDLLGTILNRLRGPLLSRAHERLSSGQTVSFGPFGISRAAIEYKGKRLPWDQITELGVTLQNGHRHLRIKCRGKVWPWCYAALYGIPNESILLNLLGELRASGRGF